MASIRALDCEKDLRTFIESCYDRNTPPHLKPQDNQKPDFAKHLV